MAIAVVETLQDLQSNSSFGEINTGDFTPNPSVGDLLIAQFFYGTTGATITLPSGWTQIIKTENAGDNLTSQISYKVADSSDASGQVLQWSKGAGNVVIKLSVTLITGQRTTNAIAASSGQATDSTATVTAPTVTPTDADSLILFYACSGGTATTISGYTLATSPPSFTEAYESNGNNFLAALAYGLRPEITATGSGTATLSASLANIGQLVVVSAPQTYSNSDTTTVTDAITYDIGGLITDTVTVTDDTDLEEGKWFNQDKNSSSWTNQDKT